MVLGSNFCRLGVSGGVVHGCGFESLDILGVNGGVVHGRGFEFLTFWGQWWRSAWSWVRIFYLLGSMVV
jgi:hypothetical protein